MSTDIPVREITKENPYKILFICLGNICRSPTAEGVFQHEVDEAGLSDYFEIDSAGTSAWHEGEPANSKTRSIAEQHGVKLHSRARQVKGSDTGYFDLLVAMDESNMDNMQHLIHTGENQKKMIKMRDFDPQPEDGNVPDPYYGGISGFENVFQIVKRSSLSLLDTLKPHIKS